MLTITVAQDGSGDFASVSEAVLAVPYDCRAEIQIGPGTYREKLVCEKQDITLIGAGMESNSLARLFPEIAIEWDYDKNYPLTPDKIAARAGRKVWWICPNGHNPLSIFFN